MTELSQPSSRFSSSSTYQRTDSDSGFLQRDELFETLTHLQTGKVKDVYVVLIGKAYWEDLINWKKFVEYGLISPEDLSLFHFTETAAEAWDIIVREHQQGILS